MLPALLLLAGLASAVTDTTHLVLVATTDVHGHATEWDYVTDRPFPGGLTRVATVVDSLRARYPGRVVVVDAGDLIQGDPFAAYWARVAPRDPHPILEAMNLVGYDAATPGNHEFNWGIPTFRQALASAAFPYVSANIRVLPADTLALPPFTVLRRGPVRVAVAGFTTPGVMVWDRENVAGRMRVAPIEGAAPGVLRAMRREADLAVVLIHSGMDGSASYDTTGVGDENVAAKLAGMPDRPDVVVVGHSHREMVDSVIGGVHFVQPRQYAQSVAIVHVDLVREGARWRPVRVRAEGLPLGEVPPSPRVARALADERAAVEAWVREPLAEAVAPMRATYARAEATPIIGLIHSVQRRRTGAQLSAASAFNLSAGFDSGAIRLADVAALYPYENTLRAIRITGAQLKAYLEQSARYFVVDPDGRIRLNDSIPGYNYDMIGGARYTIDLRQPPGQRITGLTVGGRAVGPADVFTLAINSYRQGGGGGFDMLRGAPVVYDRGENIRDLIVDELRRLRRIDPADYRDDGWRIIPEEAAARVRALFTPAADRAAAARRTGTVLRVLATADLHAALEPRPDSTGPRGGFAALKGMMDSLELACACATLRLDAGDQMQGSLLAGLTAGAAIVEALNLLDLDAAAIGNHELDWSLDTLRRRMAEAKYPMLAANVFDSATGQRPAWAAPYRIVRAGDLRVAVIGYLTAETRTAQRAEYLRGLRIGEGAAAIRDVIDEVDGLRPDVTVLLAHAGARCDARACDGEILRLARELGPGAVDVVIGGHTHESVTTEVAGIPIVVPPTRGTELAVVDVVRDGAGRLEVRPKLVPVDAAAVRPDPAMARLVDRLARRTDSIAGRVVARSRFPLTHAGAQSPLGNLIAEARRNVLRTDVAFVNNGGIRADLPAGPVTFGRLAEIQPFRNRMLRVTLTGAQVRAALEHAVSGEGGPSTHIAGLTVVYDPRRPPGRRVREVKLANGARLRDDRRYTAALDDFVAQGGDGFQSFVGAPAEDSGMLDVEVLELYLRRLPQPFTVRAETRFREAGR